MKSLSQAGRFLTLALLLAFTSLKAQDDKHPVREVTAEDRAAVEKALPKALLAPVKKPRKVIVFSKSRGYYHRSTPLGNVFFQLIQEKLKGYTFVFSDDQNDYKYDNLKQYDAIIFNNGTSIHTTITDPEIQKGIIRFVQEGGGAMAIHSASDGGWPEYNDMLGDRFAGHPWGGGEEHPFIIEDPSHPCAACLGGNTLVLKDEIYVSREPFFSRDRARVLVSIDLSDPLTASKPEGPSNRSDKDYMVSQIKRYDKGRVFYTSFGHNDSIYSDTRLLTHYLAGLQYITGDLAMDDSPIPLYDRLQKFAGPLYYEASLKLLELAKKADSDQKKNEVIELCARLLNDNKATTDSKRTAISALSLIGTPRAIQTVSAGLITEKVSHSAVLALYQGLSASDFIEVGKKASPVLTEQGKVNLINAIGVTGPVFAPLLIPSVSDPSDAVASAAIKALGNGGSSKEVEALKKIPDGSKYSLLRDQALIRIAGHSPAREALPVYEWLLNRGASGIGIKRAALKGIVLGDPAKGKGLVSQYLSGTDKALLLAAIEASAFLPGEDITQQLGALAAKAAPAEARILVYALGGRKDPQVPGTLEKLTEIPALKTYAVDALGTAGTAQQVPVLVRTLTDASEETAKEANDSLSRLRAPKVDEVIIEQLASANPETQELLLKVCAKRQTAVLAPAVIKLCSSPNSGVASEALKAVAVCGTQTELTALAGLALAAPTDSKIRTAMAKLGALLHDDTFVANTLVAFGQKAKGAQREIFLQLLGSFRTPEGLAFLTRQLTEDDPKLEYAAVKSLSQWDNAAPVPALLAVCVNGKSATNKTLAFAGVSELTVKDTALAPEAKLETLGKLLKLATNDQQLILALKGLANVAHPGVQDLVEPFLTNKNTEVADAAKTATSNSYLQLSRVSWIFQSNANNNPRSLEALADGDLSTRWASNNSMQKEGPMWLTVDLGYEQAIKSVVLDATGSSNDYPRSYELYVSNNPDDFGAPVTTGKGAVVTNIVCDAKGRYLKIVQNGKEGGLWSIHELQINGLPRGTKTGAEIKSDTIKLSSAVNGNDLPKLLDKNTDTGWSTSRNQKAGQSIVIDLESEQRVALILLDRGGQNDPFPEKLTIYSSNNPAVWGGSVGEVEGAKERKIDRIHIYPFKARYLKIEVAKDSNHPWEIRELKLFNAN